jgi:hypothetical protein
MEKDKRQKLNQQKEFTALGFKFSKIGKMVNPKLKR